MIHIVALVLLRQLIIISIYVSEGEEIHTV